MESRIQHGSKYFAHRPWRWGQNSTLSEHGHDVYQNKGNQECINVKI